MDIKQLYYFTAVAQAGSYSKAAESLAVSQPTLSVTVKKLEEELGVQLFYAFNREQHLTDEGRACGPRPSRSWTCIRRRWTI